MACKLKRLGLSGNAVKLMLSYLRNRSTTIGTNAQHAEKNYRRSCVGIEIGTTSLLDIYINDLLNLKFLGKLILYADDAVFTYACDTLEELELAMQADANMLQEWLCRNVLTLNIEKTKYMTFGKAKSLPDMPIAFGGERIGRVTQFKYLGLILDEDLSFNKHVDHVKNLVIPFIPVMWRNGKFIPMNQRKRIYLAYVQSHLLYMLPIYSECAAFKMKELEVLQNRCIKAMFRLPRLTPTTYLYSSGLQPLNEIATVERVMLIHKMVHMRVKHNFVFAVNSDVHGYSTRNCENIHIFNPKKKNSLCNEALITAIDE